MVIEFNCIDAEPGDTVCMPVTVTNFNNIVIVQFEIIWNSDVLDFVEIANPGTPKININSDFNLSGPNALKFIPFGFDPFNGETLPDGTTLFEVCFRVIGIPGSTSGFGISPSPFFDFEVVDTSDVVIPSDSISCMMTVQNAVNLVGFLTSCGPPVVGGNGSIDLTVYGGTAPYSISWLNLGTGTPGGPNMIATEGGNTIINVPAGDYDVTITDALGGTVTYTVNVSPLMLGVTTRLKHPTCYKFDNGTMWIKPTGGSDPFSYIWTSVSDPTLTGSGFIRNLGDSSLITSLPDGFYDVLVKDDNGCEVEVTVELFDNPFVFTVNALQDATCNGSGDGVIDLTITGGTPDASGNYTIIWSGGQIASPSISIGLLNPGEYSITVQDEVSQCDTIYSFTIGAENVITANVTPNDALCAGGDGSVTMRGLTNGVSGPSYSYSIYNNGVLETNQVNVGGNFTYSPLPPGMYMLIVEEGSCFSDSIPFTISEPEPIIVTFTGSTNDNCIMTGSGKAWFNITNGTPPYMLDAGAGFQDGDTLENLNAGNYILTVTDDNLCTATVSFVITQFDANEEADITFQINGTPCEGGTVTVLYKGGPIPNGVGVQWENGLTTPTIPITETDTMSVHILLGAPIFCILDDTVILNCQDKLRLDLTVTQPQCNIESTGGIKTGTVIVEATNGVEPITWIWSVPDTTQTGIYSGLTPGKYYVTVTDAVDSVSVDSFEIIAPDAIHLAFGPPDSTSCPSTCDGGVRITPEDGDPSLDYFLYWNTGTPQSDTNLFFQVDDLCQGPIDFIVSQDGICFYTDSIVIPSPAEISIDLVEAVNVTCYGGSDGSLEVIGSGGTPGYSYEWETGPSLPVVSGLSAGTYTVTVTDSHDCIQLDSFTVIQPDTLIAQIDISGTLNLSCGSSSDGIITVEVSGGNEGGYTFLWNPDVSSIYQAVNLAAGEYLITVTDPLGCSDTTSYQLTSPPPIITTWPDVEPPACFGDETVLLIEEVSGGNGNYTFNINGGELLEIGDPVLIPSGIYIVTVFDDRGCSDDTTYIIMEPNPILVSIGPDNPIIDLGDSLFIIGHVDQSDNPISMTLWTSVAPVSCPTCEGTWVYNFVPTIYTWTVTDANGCQGSGSITVGVDFDRDVYMPNVFTPNNDGRNEEFKIYTGPGVESINYLHIYDRWGNLVHSETGLLPDPAGAGNWDGTFDGELLNPGVYVYVAEISFIDNHTTLIYRGDVTLVK